MKALFDTNVILDVFLDREPFAQSASRLLSHVEAGDVTGYLCATTVTTIHYLVQKALSRKEANEKVEQLLKLFEVAPVTRLVLEAAVDLKVPDFEDAVVATAAHHAGLDVLVTRNLKDFKNSPIPTHTPDQILKVLYS